MKYKAFHKMSYGMYLVASELDGKKSGYIANTAFQVTNSPEQVAISCHKKNQTTDVIRQAGAFSVSVLKQNLDVKLIGNFGFMSGRDLDKFQDVQTQTAKTGMPIVLDECVAWLDCEVRQTLDVGSHWLIIGEVVDSAVVLDEEPLTYQVYREKYKMFSPKNSPTYIEQETLQQEEAEAKAKTPEPDAPEESAPAEEASAHVCVICGYHYNPEQGDPTRGIPPGTPFEDLPDDYRCPICNATKDYFKEV
ncbi:flavin reductase [uncultured Sunxiuqinia sp.]|uniref:flavin reductase n=1 Tax=uncultured Sunxiuqinia sp. TaxID=1573825 RepID=UPI003440BC89